MKKIGIIVLLIVFIFLCSCQEDNREKNKIEAKDDYVATLDFFTSDGSYKNYFLLMNLGHSFLRIKNCTTNNLMIGYYEMKPFEEITIGLWSITTNFGVWYNLDAFFTYNNDRYSDRVGLRTTLTNEDITQINLFLKEEPKWTPTYNCSSFCLDIWNKVSGHPINFTLETPKKVKQFFADYETLTDVTIMQNDKIGYFIDGVFIWCVMQ